MILASRKINRIGKKEKKRTHCLKYSKKILLDEIVDL